MYFFINFFQYQRPKMATVIRYNKANNTERAESNTLQNQPDLLEENKIKTTSKRPTGRPV